MVCLHCYLNALKARDGRRTRGVGRHPLSRFASTLFELILPASMRARRKAMAWPRFRSLLYVPELESYLVLGPFLGQVSCRSHLRMSSRRNDFCGSFASPFCRRICVLTLQPWSAMACCSRRPRTEFMTIARTRQVWSCFTYEFEQDDLRGNCGCRCRIWGTDASRAHQMSGYLRIPSSLLLSCNV